MYHPGLCSEFALPEQERCSPTEPSSTPRAAQFNSRKEPHYAKNSYCVFLPACSTFGRPSEFSRSDKLVRHNGSYGPDDHASDPYRYFQHRSREQGNKDPGEIPSNVGGG